MTKDHAYDAIVIGSGPNGLAAGITLAQAGLSVKIFEAKNTIGGGMRSAESTLPGFIHDLCSAIHPLGIGSPFFRTLPLDTYGLKWIHPLAPLAHPFDDGTAAILERSIEATGKTLGQDATAYKKLMEPFVANWDSLASDLLGPLRFPRHPFLMGSFAVFAVRSACGLSKSLFTGERARGLFAGLSAHSILPLDKPLTAAFGLVLGILGHAMGWPMPQGGSQKIADALASFFLSLGGEIDTGITIECIDNLPSSRAIFCDITPRQLLKIAGHRLPSQYKRKLEGYRYGPGAFKVDWALNHPIPWKAKECIRAGTVHLGGTAEEIAKSELEVWESKHPTNPYIIIAQQSLFDPTRAPEGKHTAWGYCHVPNGSSIDMTERIEAQLERFAPGFKDCVMARSTKSAIELEQYNANYVGGDINGGVQDMYQLFTRPTARLVPYSTPLKGLYICSSSTPPGGGVHGMCGHHAATAALKSIF
jgi:phytoene dehydrogenase-like protein